MIANVSNAWMKPSIDSIKVGIFKIENVNFLQFTGFCSAVCSCKTQSSMRTEVKIQFLTEIKERKKMLSDFQRLG